MKLRLWRYEMTVTLRKRLSKAERQAIIDRLTETLRDIDRQWEVVPKRRIVTRTAPVSVGRVEPSAGLHIDEIHPRGCTCDD